MALIEIDSDDLARLKAEATGAKNSKTILDKLGGDPKTRTRLLRLMKEADPSLVVPEIDAAQPVLDEVAALRKELADEKKAAAEKTTKDQKEADEREAQQSIDSGRALLRKRGYQDEGIAKVEELMSKRRIADYEAAALAFEQTQPKDEPIIPSNLGRGFDLFGDQAEGNSLLEAVKKSNPKNQRALMQWQNKELSAALRDERSRAA